MFYAACVGLIVAITLAFSAFAAMNMEKKTLAKWGFLIASFLFLPSGIIALITFKAPMAEWAKQTTKEFIDEHGVELIDQAVEKSKVEMKNQLTKMFSDFKDQSKKIIKDSLTDATQNGLNQFFKRNEK